MKTEIDIYRNRQTGKCWKLEPSCKEVVTLRRGVRLETLEREDFERMFEAVA